MKDGQSRENGSIGYTRRRGNQRWTIQREWQCTQDEGAIKDGQSRENGSIGYTRRRGNQIWTIQRKWQHRVHKTKGQPKMDNPDKMAGYTRRRGNQRRTIQRKWQGTQDEGVIKDGQCRDNCRVHKTKGQSKMDNPEKMAGYTRRRGNQRWTIQRKWQGTQDEGAIKDGQSRENGRLYKTKGQSKMGNPKKTAGYTRRRDNQR